jgi:hypothetical protein
LDIFEGGGLSPMGVESEINTGHDANVMKKKLNQIM